MYTYNTSSPRPFYVDGKIKIVFVIGSEAFDINGNPVSFNVITAVPDNVLAAYHTIIDQYAVLPDAVAAAAQMLRIDTKPETLGSHNSDLLKTSTWIGPNFQYMLAIECIKKLAKETNTNRKNKILKMYMDYFISQKFDISLLDV